MKKRKKGGGRTRGSGVKTSIIPQREQFTDIVSKIIHGHREWRMVRLRELVREHEADDKETQRKNLERWRKEGTAREDATEDQILERWRLPDNYLSAHKTEIGTQEIDARWRELAAEFERAVLRGDDDWFERQAKAIRWRDMRTARQKARARFDAAVVRELKVYFWRTRAEERRRNPDIRSATLEPAGKRVDVVVRQIYDSLDKEQCATDRHPHGVKVKGCYFENRERCVDAIHAVEKLLEIQLRKEQGQRPRTKPSKPLSTDLYHGLSYKARRCAHRNRETYRSNRAVRIPRHGVAIRRQTR